MISVEENIRYDVDDTTCPSKLFQAKDISIQKIIDKGMLRPGFFTSPAT